MAGFLTTDWAQQVAERANGWPDDEVRATKLQDYWDWIDLAKTGVTGALALVDRDLPAGAGAEGDTLLLHLEAGTVTGTEVGARVELEPRADFVLAGDHADWLALLDGYDVGKTIMYRKVVLEKGEVLDFFMAAYYWVELLAALRDVPVEAGEPISA